MSILKFRIAIRLVIHDSKAFVEIRIINSVKSYFYGGGKFLIPSYFYDNFGSNYKRSFIKQERDFLIFRSFSVGGSSCCPCVKLDVGPVNFSDWQISVPTKSCWRVGQLSSSCLIIIYGMYLLGQVSKTSNNLHYWAVFPLQRQRHLFVIVYFWKNNFDQHSTVCALVFKFEI